MACSISRFIDFAVMLPLFSQKIKSGINLQDSVAVAHREIFLFVREGAFREGGADKIFVVVVHDAGAQRII